MVLAHCPSKIRPHPIRAPQATPASLQATQGLPKGSTGDPKAPQREPKTTQDRSKTSQRCPTKRHKSKNMYEK